MNPYEVLGINETSSIEEISKVFHMLAKQYHPDTASSENERQSKEKKFALITQAYNMIKNNGIKTSDREYDNDDHYEQAIMNKAKYFMSKKDYNSAIKVLNRINSKLSNDAAMLLGEAYLRKERYHDALKYFRRIHDNNAWNIEAKFKMAYIYEKINLKNSAKKIYEEILAIDSNNEKAMDRISALKQNKFSLSSLFRKG